jgi:hypothetical protein
MAHFIAPADTSGITLSTGFHPVRDGIVEVPDTAHEGDRLGLAANGFVPAPAAPIEGKAKKPSADAPAPVTDPE